MSYCASLLCSEHLLLIETYVYAVAFLIVQHKMLHLVIMCMLEVSPNGIIKCCYGKNNCPNNCAAVCNGISIEIKCPVLDSPYYNYRYYIPKRYVPQVMLEMFTQETSKGWFIICSSDSVSVLEFECNEEIWAQISAILVDLYSNEITTKHILRKITEQYGKKSIKILADIPLYTGTYGSENYDLNSVPYNKLQVLNNEQIIVEEITERIKIMAVEAAEVIKKSSEISCQKATEMLIFMMSDTDRIKSENMENYTHPVGYVLKGPSLPVFKMHNIINHLQNTLKQSGVEVICETSDGQWANMCFKSADGFPLTLLHLQKRTWNAARWGVLNKLCDLSCITKDDLVHILETPYKPALCSITGNATIFMNFNGNQRQLSVASNGGHVKFCGLLRHINWSDIDITKEELLKSQVSSGKPPKNIGLLNSDFNILTTLPDDLIHDIATDMGNVDPCNLNLDEVLTSEKFNILEDICNFLKLLDENR